MALSLSFKFILLCISNYNIDLRTGDFWLLISSVEDISIVKGMRFIRLQNAIISSLRYAGLFKYGGFRVLIIININKS